MVPGPAVVGVAPSPDGRVLSGLSSSCYVYGGFPAGVDSIASLLAQSDTRVWTTRPCFFFFKAGLGTKESNTRPSRGGCSAPRAVRQVRPPQGPPEGCRNPFFFNLCAYKCSKCASYALVFSSCRRDGDWAAAYDMWTLYGPLSSAHEPAHVF